MPIDLGAILTAVNWIYWLLAGLALALAFIKPRSASGKVIATSVVAVTFGYLPITLVFDRVLQTQQARVDKLDNGGANAAQPDDAMARQTKAMMMAHYLCKKAGESVYRTAENVEGVLLLKIRDSYNHQDQFRLDDPYGHDSWGDEYIKSFFLEPTLHANRDASGELKAKIRRDYAGYRYVEAISPTDGKRYRYTGAIKVVGRKDPNAPNVKRNLQLYPTYDLNNYAFVLDKVPAPGAPPRYGVTYDDLSTREEREFWIAGSSLRVIDLKTNEVMAERIGYMWDPGQGNRSGGRSPWLAAADYACPPFWPETRRQPGFTYQSYQTRRFVTKVLRPIAEE